MLQPQFTSPAQIVATQQAAVIASDQVQAKLDAEAKAVENRLEGLCWKEFESARRAKEVIQNEMLDLLRARKSEYSAAELALIRGEGGGSEIYIPLPQEKCATAAAWLWELYGGDRPFDCEPTPVPDIPAAVMQQIEAEGAMMFQQMGPLVADTPEALRDFVESLKDKLRTEARQFAQKRADRNTEKVQDVLVEGGYYKALRDALDDCVALKAGFIHGPIVKMKKCLVWSADGRTAKIERVAKRVFEAPSPFDVYPAPGSGDVQHSHISIRLRLTASDLEQFVDVEGFKSDRIKAAIEKYGTGGLQNWWWEDVERADLEGRNADSLITQQGLYDVILHYTHATGKMLAEFGLKDAGLKPSEVYSVSTWMLGKGELLGAKLNDDPEGKRPLIKFGFRRVRGAFWCQGVTEIIRDLTRMANAAARSLANNMAMAAGFFTEVQVDRLAPNAPITTPAPYSVIQTIAPEAGSAGPAVYTHQAQINAQVYIAIYGWISQLADTAVGLASFMSGSATGGGAADTSSGLAQLNEMATRTFKFTVADIDEAQADVIDRVHTDLVLTEGQTDPDLIGDINVVVKGVKAFGDRQAQQVRLNELVMTMNNPTDLAITGPEGRAELLRAALDGFDGIDLDRTIPGREQIIYKAKQAAMAAAGVGPDGQPLPGQVQPPAARATNPDGSVQGDRGVMA